MIPYIPIKLGRGTLEPEYSTGHVKSKSSQEEEKLCFYVAFSSHGTNVKANLSVKKKNPYVSIKSLCLDASFLQELYSKARQIQETFGPEEY